MFEAAHIDQAGGDDLPAGDRGDPGHRYEDAALAGDLDDQTEHPGSAREAEGDHHVPNASDAVTQRVEDVETRQSGDENANGCTHDSTG